MIKDHLSLFFVATNNGKVSLSKSEELRERHENAVISNPETLTDLCDTESLNLLTNALAVELICNPSVIGFQAEDKVSVGFPHCRFNGPQGTDELTRSTSLLLGLSRLLGARDVAFSITDGLFVEYIQLTSKSSRLVSLPLCQTRLTRGFGANGGLNNS